MFGNLCVCFRQEMQHVVKVMQEYIAHQILHVTWREFQRDLEQRVETLDDLRRTHAEYLDKCNLRCVHLNCIVR